MTQLAAAARGHGRARPGPRRMRRRAPSSTAASTAAMMSGVEAVENVMLVDLSNAYLACSRRGRGGRHGSVELQWRSKARPAGPAASATGPPRLRRRRVPPPALRLAPLSSQTHQSTPCMTTAARRAPRAPFTHRSAHAQMPAPPPTHQSTLYIATAAPGAMPLMPPSTRGEPDITAATPPLPAAVLDVSAARARAGALASVAAGSLAAPLARQPHPPRARAACVHTLPLSAPQRHSTTCSARSSRPPAIPAAAPLSRLPFNPPPPPLHLLALT